MARLFTEGFESGVFLRSSGGLWISEDAYIRTGASTYGFTNGGNDRFATGTIYRYLSSDPYNHPIYTEIYTKFFIKADNSWTCGLYPDTATSYSHANIYWTTSNRVIKARSNTDTVIATGNIQVEPSVVYRIEWYWKASNPYSSSNGSMIVKVNGIVDPGINLTNSVRTMYTDSTGSKTFYLSSSYNNTGMGFDDIVVDDAQWVGNTRIQWLEPTADAAVDWSPSSGANYSCVSEATPSTTQYVFTSTSGHKDRYTLDNLTDSTSTPIDQIKSVQLTAYARQQGTSAVPYLSLGLELSGTDMTSSAQAVMEDTWSTYSNIYETKPGGGAFTKANVDDLTAFFRASS